MSTNAEMMEMATIDKEMAEERSEALQGEVGAFSYSPIIRKCEFWISVLVAKLRG